MTRDHPSRPTIDRIVRARPAELLEGRNTRAETPTFVAQPLDRDPASECERLHPSASFPREVAGESVAADVVKCRLTEPDRGRLRRLLDRRAGNRLLAVFSTGVCDYTKPGVEQRGLAGTWLRF